MQHKSAIDLDVFMRGSRTYVQGTQLVARTAELVEPSGYTLKKAAFTTITDKVVGAVPLESEADLDRESAGLVTFVKDDEDDLIFGLFETDRPAPRKDVPFTFEIALEEEREDGSDYAYSGVVTLSDLLDSIVQSIKAFFERQSSSNYDIWFTGMRNLSLPSALSGMQLHGMIRFTVLRSQHQGNQYQSLLRVTVESHAFKTLDGYVTFAHKVRDN